MESNENEVKVITYKFKNATVRMHVPNITEEERKLRLSLIEQAAIDLLMKGD